MWKCKYIYTFYLSFFVFIPRSFCQNKIGGVSKVLGTVTLNIAVVNPSCGYNNGSILIIASGGTAPYTYSLNGEIQNNGYYPGINAFGNGLYDIDVTDATGQIVTSQVTLADVLPPAVISVQSYQRPTTCTSADGSFTMIGSDGLPPYQYSIDGINFSTNNTFSNLTGGMYYIFVRDANGCITKGGFGFIGEFTALNNCGLYCNGEGGLTACKNDGYLDVRAEGGTPPYLFSIDGINYQTSFYPNSSNDFDNLPSGLYHLYVKDAIGTVVVSGYQLLQNCDVLISYIGVAATCNQSDGSITINVSDGVAPYTYTIDGVNYQTSNEFTGLAKGAYSVSVVDAMGVSRSKQVVVYDKCPTVTATETDETCGQKNGTLTATGLQGTAPYGFSIDGINYQVSNVFLGLPAGTYTITIKDVNGFTSTTTSTIKNNCLQLSGTVINTTCGNSNGSVTAIGTNGTAPYLYSIDDVNFQPGNIFPGLKAGSFTIFSMDANGLTASIALTITDAPSPQIDITTIQASCDNTNGVININAIGGTAPVSYSIDNGTTYQSGNIFNSMDSGQYRVIAKDANGCIANVMTQLTALPTTFFSLGNDTTLCAGQSLLLDGPALPGYQYQWQDNSTNNDYIVTFSGKYSLKVKNQFGCSSTSSINVNFSPMPVFSIGNDTSVCTGKILTLSPLPIPQGNYLWNTGSTANSLAINSPGIYSLQVTTNGCASQKSITVNYRPMPVINLGNDTTLCEGTALFLDATNNNAVYTWQDGSTQPTLTINNQGTYSVKVDENGCDTSGTIKVSYITKPVVDIGADTTLCVTQKLLLDASYPYSTYLWQDGSTSSQFNVTQEGAYTVDVTNTCGDTKNSIKVTYENCACRFSVPNAFTPNNDGLNDVFVPRNQCLFSNYELKIFNRWGQLIFSSRNSSIGWDGSFESQQQPAGTYVWMLSFTDNLTEKYMQKNGTVILIR